MSDAFTNSDQGASTFNLCRTGSGFPNYDISLYGTVNDTLPCLLITT